MRRVLLNYISLQQSCSSTWMSIETDQVPNWIVVYLDILPFLWGEVFILFLFFGPLVPWSSNPVLPWSSRPLHLVPSLSGPLVLWSPHCLVPWLSGPLVPSSSGPLLLWSSGPLVLCSFSFLSSNLSFALFYYQFYVFTLSCVC